MYVGDSKQQQRETGNKDKERPQTVTGGAVVVELGRIQWMRTPRSGTNRVVVAIWILAL
jgi:hypothetical protein